MRIVGPKPLLGCSLNDLSMTMTCCIVLCLTNFILSSPPPSSTPGDMSATGKKRHTCAECSKTFSKRSHLTRHRCVPIRGFLSPFCEGDQVLHLDPLVLRHFGPSPPCFFSVHSRHVPRCGSADWAAIVLSQHTVASFARHLHHPNPVAGACTHRFPGHVCRKI
jgi:hypothetical protein